MKRGYWIALGVVLMGSGIAAIGSGCGGNEDAPIDADNDAGDGATAPPTNTSGGTSGTGTGGDPGDAGGAGDTGPGAPPPIASNPHLVTCGASACDAGRPGGNCCVPRDAGAANGTCENDCNNESFELRCDEKADCQGNDRCCFERNGNDYQGRCDNNCDGNANQRIELCRTSDQCANDAGCADRTCTVGNGPPQSQHSVILRVCGTPDACK